MDLALRPRPFRLVLIATVAAALVLAGPVASASAAYKRPPTGKWQFHNLFDDTKRGAFALGKKGRATVIRRLVLVVGAEKREMCGKRVKLVGRPRLRRHSSASGRWAFAGMRRGLFVPKRVRLKVDRKTRRGKLMVLFDETGRLADTARVEYGDCSLRFFASKPR